MSAQNGLEKSDIESLIRAKAQTVKSLKLLKERILKVHKDCSIAKTVGASTSTVGTIATIVGIFLAPVTAGVSLGLTIGGLTATLLGGGTALGTGIVETVKIKKWTDELCKSIIDLENELERIGEKIRTDLLWKEYMKSATGCVGYVCFQSLDAVRLARILKFLTITAPKYGMLKPAVTSVFAAKQVPYGFFLDSDHFVTQGMAKVGVQTTKIGTIGLRILAVGVGAVGIGFDVYTIVDTWVNDPKLVSQIDKICEHLEENQSGLKKLKDEF